MNKEEEKFLTELILKKSDLFFQEGNKLTHTPYIPKYTDTLKYKKKKSVDRSDKCQNKE